MNLACMCVLAFVITYLLLCAYKTSDRNRCIVSITGESIRIEGCEFTPEFIEYAKGLAIPSIW